MKVYRCDRCGNHYTDKEKRNTIDVFEIVNDSPKYISSLYISTNIPSPCPQETLDLCPVCVVSLIDWIESGNAEDGRKFKYEPVDTKVIKQKIIDILKEAKEDDQC